MPTTQSRSLVQQAFSNRYKPTWSDCKLPSSPIKLQSRPLKLPNHIKSRSTNVTLKRTTVQLGKSPIQRKCSILQTGTSTEKSPKLRYSYGAGRDILLRKSNQRAQTYNINSSKKVEDKTARPYTTGVLLEKKNTKRTEVMNSVEGIRRRNRSNCKYIYNGVNRIEYNRPSNLQMSQISHKNLTKIYSSNHYQPHSEILTKLKTNSEWKTANSSIRYFPVNDKMLDIHQKNPFLTPNSVIMSRRRI